MKKLKLNLAESGKEMLSKEQMKQITGGYDHCFFQCVGEGPWNIYGTIDVPYGFTCGTYSPQQQLWDCQQKYPFIQSTVCYC